MTKLTLEDLTQIAHDFLRDEYGLTLEIPIKRNNRLKRSLARFLRSHDCKTAVEIDVSGDLLTYATDAIAIDTIKHECVHYALFTQGRKYRDGQSDFELELKRLGISNNYENNHATPIGVCYVFTCGNCGDECTTSSKAAYKAQGYGYSSHCCRKDLTFVRTAIYDGEKEVTQ